VLGLLSVPADDWARLGKPQAVAGSPGELPPQGHAAEVAQVFSDAEVERRIAARIAARRAKNWPESDRIRAELAAGGVVLEDKPGGATVWRRA
jgi:cysteinyl-tRNA synthetase